MCILTCYKINIPISFYIFQCNRISLQYNHLPARLFIRLDTMWVRIYVEV